MNVTRTRVPVLSLLLCTLLLGSAWWGTAPDASVPEDRVPLAVGTPRIALPSRPIRVGLAPEPARSFELEISHPYEIRPVGGGAILDSGAKLARTTVVATSGGLKIGRTAFPSSRLEIAAAKSPAIWIDGHQYRGTVRLYRQAGGTLQAVNVLPLEDYVASVVDSEMPADFPVEARKAQAIVARTYAVYQMQQASSESILDLYASTRSQKYLGFQYRDRDRLLAGESAAARDVAQATRGRVCLWNGEVFCTYYCAVCGGSTVRGTEVFADAAPPLKPVPCDWCREARLYRWTAEIAKRDAGLDLEGLLQKDGRSIGTLRTVSLAASPAGSFPLFDLRTQKQSVRVTGADLREAMSGRGLYSPRFTIEDRGQTLLVKGQGHGHGVGLCQWGARGLALAGKDCDQILAHYYPGMRVAQAK